MWVDMPDKNGWWWFYGEPYMGEMGGHYTGTVKPTIKLCTAKVLEIGKTRVAIMNGTTVYLRKWDGKNKGFFGKWMYIEEPVTPCLT